MPNKKVFIGDDNPTGKKPNLYHYTHLRGYHACRPEDISSYHTHGILALTEEEKQQNAAKIFNKTLEEILDDENQINLTETPQVYFTVFRNELVTDAGHYLCYGSEHFAGVAARLDRGIVGRYHNILLKTGIPTIFICDVPVSYIPNYLLDDINENYDPSYENCGFWINQDLPPEYIIGHEHPQKIFDPLCHIVRINEKNTCLHCHKSNA